jgi:hypothetical protein
MKLARRVNNVSVQQHAIALKKIVQWYKVLVSFLGFQSASQTMIVMGAHAWRLSHVLRIALQETPRAATVIRASFRHRNVRPMSIVPPGPALRGEPAIRGAQWAIQAVVLVTRASRTHVLVRILKDAILQVVDQAKSASRMTNAFPQAVNVQPMAGCVPAIVSVVAALKVPASEKIPKVVA